MRELPCRRSRLATYLFCPMSYACTPPSSPSCYGCMLRHDPTTGAAGAALSFIHTDDTPRGGRGTEAPHKLRALLLLLCPRYTLEYTVLTLTLTITITLRPGEAQLRLWCDASARPCDADAFLTRCFDIVTQCAATARPVLKIQTASVDSEPWDVLLPTGVPRSEHGFI